ncbi:hypothetical protein GHT06_018897 [Daphnia sinensis]|uniref:SEFIR domain-containing protein n=1 Tax=Daphnia sinensis TaxID=1820382 RepID=A0AAD5LEQ3_9CRUS|nr:hypothetical protein GHT06_018897 [Daphnia sinensis]
MNLPFSLLVIVFGFCVLPRGAAHEPNSIIPLDINGTVRNGSTAYYNRTTATLMLRLKMLIHKHNSKKKQPPDAKQSQMFYRFDLALTGDAHLPNDSWQSNFCANAIAKFAGACRERHLFTKYYKKNDTDYEVEIPVVFDHIYSGCYKLIIKCCTDKRSCDGSCGNKAGIYEYHLGRLETHLLNVNVTRMNITMRLAQMERGAEVEFSVNYFEDSHKILEFKEFHVEIKDYYTNKTIAKAITTSKVVRFPSCNVSCSQPSSHPIKPYRCLCLPVGNYTMAINVADSRCNYPTQVCATYQHPCKRITNRPVLINLSYTGGVKNSMPPDIIVSPFSGISSFLVLLLALLSIISLATLFFFKRNWLSSRRNDQYAHHAQNGPEEMVPFTLAGRHVRVLLVYDMTDDLMKEKVSSLRKQFKTSGISTVYDAGDPEQEEDVIIRGECHWFSGHLNDPSVKVVVIQSNGVIDCQKELNRNKKADSISAQDFQGSSGLLFVLSQLIAIAASSVNENCIYGRIFITTYDNFDSSTAINPLTPYRCFKLPEHYRMLIRQLVIHTQIER